MKKYKSLLLYLQFSLLLNSTFVHAAGVSASESDLENVTFGAASCYLLTKITDESSLTDEDFVITKYVGDVSIGNLTPVKYLLTFNNPLGDDPNVGNPAVRYFKWSVDENGNKSLVNTGPYDTVKDITAYSSNNVRLDTTTNWTDGSNINNNSFLNRGTASVILEGGAIYNSENSKIGNIGTYIGLTKEGFIGNFVEASELTTDNVYGGAIFNAGYINNIYSGFICNYAAGNGTASGGGIYNIGSISGRIRSDFIANHANDFGGAICNMGYIYGILTSSFVGNYADGEGGAIYNGQSNTIKTIEADFIDNYAMNGGAIKNLGYIGSISGDFIGNHAFGTMHYNYKYDGSGGAIYGGSISEITGNFVNNSALLGGAIFGQNIETIRGNFIGNHVSSVIDLSPNGGAIYVRGVVRNIIGNFSDNYADGSTSGYASGGAIYINTGNYFTAIENITGDFIDNYAYVRNLNTWYAETKGGAVYNVLGIIGNITGNFINNYAQVNLETFSDKYSSSGSAMGGAIYTWLIDNIVGDFINNHVSVSSTRGESRYPYDIEMRAEGGALYCHNDSEKTINVTGNFINNHAVMDFHTSKEDFSIKFIVRGGAISTSSRSSIIFNNSVFSNNFLKLSYPDAKYNHLSESVQGGAIFLPGSTITFNINEDRKVKSYGNYAEINGIKDDANGGFLYMADSALVNFNTEKGSSYIIGDGRAGYDSIASDDSNNIINKNGKGEVVVNSSMEFYKGTLNVNGGNMTVNNKLGASRVMIANGASLSVKVNSNGSVFTNAALNYSNDGTLNLIAGETLASGNYDVFVFENPETVYFGNVKSYGGIFDHATGTFIVENALNLTIGETNPVNVQSNGRILAVGAAAEDTSIVMNFNSAAGVTVNSVFATTESDIGFAEIVNSINAKNLLLAESFAFDVENLGIEDTVNLSFFVGEGYDISQFTVYHKDAELGWELANISNLEYDGEYLSFIVDGFSSYGYVAAVPEASTYATIMGAISLCLIFSRRRK